MGLGGISPVQLIIILVIVLLIFGTKKLRNFGGDLGGAIKGFKKAVNDDGAKEGTTEKSEITDDAKEETVSAEAAKTKTEEKSS